MAWIRVDDHFDEHHKMQEVGPLGIALWLAGLAYCNRNLTDGHIPWSKARSLLSWEFLGPPTDDERGRKVMTVAVTCGMQGDDVKSTFVIDLLLHAGLWEEEDGGYYVHDYPEYQPTKSQIEAQRSATADRVSQWRNRNAVSNAVTNNVSNANVTSDVHMLPNPNPSSTDEMIQRTREDDEDQWQMEDATLKARQAGYTMEEITGGITKIKRAGKPVTRLAPYLLKVLKGERELVENGKAPPQAVVPPTKYVTVPAGMETK